MSSCNHFFTNQHFFPCPDFTIYIRANEPHQEDLKMICLDRRTHRNLWRHSGSQICSGAERSGPFCSGNASSSPGLLQGTFQPAFLFTPSPGGLTQPQSAPRTPSVLQLARTNSPPPKASTHPNQHSGPGGSHL